MAYRLETMNTSSKSGRRALQLALVGVVLLIASTAVNAGGFFDAQMRRSAAENVQIEAVSRTGAVDSKCSGTQPSLPNFVCIEGVWTSPTSIVLEKSDLIINAKNGVVKINGSITFNGVGKLIFSDKESVLNVSECILVAKKPANVIFNFAIASPFQNYRPLVSYGSAPICHSQVTSLTFSAPNAGSCKRVVIHGVSHLDTDIIIAFGLNSYNCTVIAITIGVVGGTLGISTLVAILTIFLMRRKQSDYAQLHNYAEDTPIRRSHGMH